MFLLHFYVYVSHRDRGHDLSDNCSSIPRVEVFPIDVLTVFALEVVGMTGALTFHRTPHRKQWANVLAPPELALSRNSVLDFSAIRERG